MKAKITNPAGEEVEHKKTKVEGDKMTVVSRIIVF